MINFIQLNQNITECDYAIIDNSVLENIHELLVSGSADTVKYIHELSIQYNSDKKNIIKKYFNYVIRNKKELIKPAFLNIVELLMHSNNTNIRHLLQYFVVHMQEYYAKS